MANQVGHLILICLLTIWIISLVKCLFKTSLFKTFAHFSVGWSIILLLIAHSGCVILSKPLTLYRPLIPHIIYVVIVELTPTSKALG